MHPVQIASRSETGARDNNQDGLRHGEAGTGWYAVLSDGAGGHRGGAIASDLVVRTVEHEIAMGAAGAAPPDLLRIAHIAHDALTERQEGATGRERMHATLVSFWIDGDRQAATWSHVGDSRLYLLRGGRANCLTRDDSVVQSLLDAGLVDAEMAQVHPARKQLLAALGQEQPLDPHPGEKELLLQEGDAFLLCSDGWHDVVNAGCIEATLAEARDPDDWLERMASTVRERADPKQDNYSAIALWVGEPHAITRPLPPYSLPNEVQP